MHLHALACIHLHAFLHAFTCIYVHACLQGGLLEEVRWVAAQLQLRSWPAAAGGAPEGPVDNLLSVSSPLSNDSGDSEDPKDKIKKESFRGGVLQGIGALRKKKGLGFRV